MNEVTDNLIKRAHMDIMGARASEARKLVELTVLECIELLAEEVKLEITRRNNSGSASAHREHESKIRHFEHVIDHTKKHFGV